MLWMIRSFPGNTDRIVEFLELNIIAVHWGIGDLTGCNSKDDIAKVVSQENLQQRDASLKTGLLNRFVNYMEVGDFCIVPHGDVFYVGIIRSEYYFDPNSPKYEHQREVEWLCGDKPFGRREDLPAKLQASLKTQLGLADLTQHELIFNQYMNKKQGIVNADDSEEKDSLVFELDSLVKDAMGIIKEEMKSDDPNRRLQAAIAVMKLNV